MRSHLTNRLVPEGRARASDIVDVQPTDLTKLACCMARAFETDPVLRYLMPDQPIRQQRAQHFYRAVLEQFSGIGVIMTDPGRSCAAVWQKPNPARIGLIRQLVFSLRMAGLLRDRALKGHSLLGEMERVHHRDPHWYLALLGTDPDRQGTGLASALLNRVLRQCDRDGTPAYLESSKETNIAFYRRHGFEVVDEIQIVNGPKLWPMLRAPKL